MKTLRFWLLQCLILLALVEGGLTLGYYVMNDTWHWEKSERFAVRDFIRPTDDRRFITMIPNYENPAYSVRDHAPWVLKVDEHGFRAGANQPRLDRPNIFVIGDSIPFGWERNAEDSIPGHLQKLIANQGLDLGVVNAAIPSMSMDQAIERYLIEIDGTYPVHTVILQSYDPASQFTFWGREWDMSLCWANPHPSQEPEGVLRYSGTWTLIKKMTTIEESLQPDDSVAFAAFHDGINGSLQKLYAATRGKAEVILLPLAVPQKALATLSPQRRKAIEAMNQALADFAATHSGVRYVDILPALAAQPDADIFIDACCHFTSQGAELVAKQVFQAITP